MKEEALSKDCNPKQVEQKINHLQEKWKEAHDWVTGETGAGVWLGNEGSWKDSVLKNVNIILTFTTFLLTGQVLNQR